ncbi:MAG: polysaccharide deacetylase family protein [Rhizobiaceae bacterium]
MRIFTGSLGLALSCFIASSAVASCGVNALGTSRTLTVDTSKFREIQGYEKSFGLRHKEVVLTFDDGPIAGKTPRILKALKKECVKATFFYVGRMAKAYPRLVRRVVADGHTLAHHTDNHNRLPSYSTKGVARHIDKGIRDIQKIAYGRNSSVPRVPFFRYPYLSRNKSTDRVLSRKGLISFGANIDSLDWKKDSPNTVHNRIMRILRRKGKGIILMHDIQGRTAKMLPRLLRSLKEEGYRVVHMVPKGGAVPRWTPNEGEYVVASVKKPKVKAKVELAMLKPAVVEKPKVAPIITASTQTDVDRSGVKAVVTKLRPAVSKKPRVVIKKRRVKKRKRLVKRYKKKSFVILAGGKRKRKARIKKRGWKLRRSQWIVN